MHDMEVCAWSMRSRWPFLMAFRPADLLLLLMGAETGVFIRVAQGIAARSAMVTYLACGQQLAPNLTRFTSDGIHPTAAGAAYGNPAHTLVVGH